MQRRELPVMGLDYHGSTPIHSDSLWKEQKINGIFINHVFLEIRFFFLFCARKGTLERYYVRPVHPAQLLNLSFHNAEAERASERKSFQGRIILMICITSWIVSSPTRLFNELAPSFGFIFYYFVTGF